MTQQRRVITVIPCIEKLTKVSLWGPSFEPRYHQITTVLYREYVDYHSEHRVTPEYGVSQLDNRYGGFFSLEDHRTTETGRCDCMGGSEGKRRNDCRDFGIWKGTPEEVESNPQLTHDISLRAAYLNDIEIKEADRKAIAKEKAREKAKVNNQRAKEKREIEELARQRARRFSEQEPPPPRVRNPDNVENHSGCGKPLARSIEELERFKATPVTWEFEGVRWYCDCGTTAVASASI
jgi:hypothetical protein